MYLKILVAAFAIAMTATSYAQTLPNPACAAAAHHQLDFWIGDWNVSVTGKDGTFATSHIESVMNGCGIRESYNAPTTPAGPYAGTSYSAFNRNDSHWHQFYVDTNGNSTWFTGGMEGASLTLTAPGKNGSTQKMEYRPMPDGSVRQIGTVTTDGGKTWQPGYDYTYRRK